MEKLEERVYCTTCKHKNIHYIVQTYKEESNPQYDFQWCAQYHIVKCGGCETTAFVKQYGDEDMLDYVNGELTWVESFKVYPSEPEEINEKDILYKIWEKGEGRKQSFKNLPQNLMSLYEQVIHSFHMGYYLLSASGLRSLIEGVCKHLGIDRGYIYNADGSKKLNDKNQEILAKNLAGMIFGLYEKSHITLAHALVLQQVKLIGNDAIHDIVTPNYTNLSESISIVERLIYDIYELKNHTLLEKK